MRKVIPTLGFILFIVLGCTTESDDVMPENNEAYELRDIQWILEEGDGQEIIEKELPGRFFKNEGDTIMQVIIGLPKEQGSSHFQFDLPEDLTFNLHSASVSVIAHIDLLSDSYSHIGGGTKVPFQLAESFFPFSISIEETTGLNPHTQMSYRETIFLKKNIATFKARFEQPGTKDSFELKGKWTGFFYHTMESKSVIEEID